MSVQIQEMQDHMLTHVEAFTTLPTKLGQLWQSFYTQEL